MTKQKDYLIPKLVQLRRAIKILRIVQQNQGSTLKKTGKCYVQSYIKTNNWTEARTDCKRLGGDLATIGDQETQDFLLNITRVGGIFIGAEKKAGVWTWVDGSTWYGFANWAHNEPASYNVVVIIGIPNTLWYGWEKVTGGNYFNYLPSN